MPSILTGRPTFAYKGITMAGPAEGPNQIERVVILKGERFDVRPGETLTVTGTMRLLSHPRARVGWRRAAKLLGRYGALR